MPSAMTLRDEPTNARRADPNAAARAMTSRDAREIGEILASIRRMIADGAEPRASIGAELRRRAGDAMDLTTLEDALAASAAHEIDLDAMAEAVMAEARRADAAAFQVQDDERSGWPELDDLMRVADSTFGRASAPEQQVQPDVPPQRTSFRLRSIEAETDVETGSDTPVTSPWIGDDLEGMLDPIAQPEASPPGAVGDERRADMAADAPAAVDEPADYGDAPDAATPPTLGVATGEAAAEAERSEPASAAAKIPLAGLPPVNPLPSLRPTDQVERDAHLVRELRSRIRKDMESRRSERSPRRPDQKILQRVGGLDRRPRPPVDAAPQAEAALERSSAQRTERFQAFHRSLESAEVPIETQRAMAEPQAPKDRAAEDPDAELIRRITEAVLRQLREHRSGQPD